MIRWSEFIIQPNQEESLRLPPESFQLRARKEPSSKDAVNSRLYESQGAAVPQQQGKYYRSDEGNTIYTIMTATPRSPEEVAVMRSFPDGTIDLLDARAALSRYENNVKKAVDALFLQVTATTTAEAAVIDSFPRGSVDVFEARGALQSMNNSVKKAVGVLKAEKQEAPTYFDMAPLSSRTDRRDFRQSKPYDSTGPNLSMNPFFDRYDPTRDPRNMIREVRSVVYETKEPDRGLKESERIRERVFTGRYTPEDKAVTKLTDWFDLPRPTIDNPEIVYRTPLTSMGAKISK
jgi:hypothetical protein